MNNKGKSIATGVALTMVAGTAAAVAMSNNSMRSQKKKLKKNATKVVRTVGDIVGEVTNSIK